MAERQRAMGAECHPVSSPAGVAQHVVCCLLGQGQLAPQVYEEMSPSSLQSQLGSMGELTAFPKQPSPAPAIFPPPLYLPSTQSIFYMGRLLRPWSTPCSKDIAQFFLLWEGLFY